MSSDPRLMALPALRRLAEEQARELMEAARSHRGMFSDHAEGAVYEAHLTLLCDLSRPASRDAVAELCREAVGVVADDPYQELLFVDPLDSGVAEPWRLTSPRCATTLLHDIGEPKWVEVPGLLGATSPTEALTLIALCILGGGDAR